MKRHFDKELSEFKKEIIHMASLTEKAIHNSVTAMKKQDKNMALEVIANDTDIDEMEVNLEKKAMNMLALHQPVAKDLRFITTGMKINNELERIADLAVNVSKRVLELSDQPMLKPLIDIPLLSDLAKSMVTESINAFVNKDQKKAIEVIMKDPQANELRDKIHNDLINDYMAKDSNTVKRAIPLLITSRHLERICDHAKYIAEDIIYMLDAKIVKHHYEKIEEIKQ